MRKVVDSFMFFNELDILKLRLAELNDVVDTFILVEATLTHSGLPKRLYFQENKDLFEKYLHKIVHVVLDDLPRENVWTWTREMGQRDQIWRGVKQLTLKNDDIFMWADVDEIPDSDRVMSLKINGLPGGIHCFSMDMYYYNMTCKNTNQWTHAKVCEFGMLGESPPLSSWRTTGGFPILEKSGWHLSCFGDAEFISTKLKSFAHDEFNTEYYTNVERISARIKDGTDLLDRNYVSWTHVPINSNTYLPKNVSMII
jgi:beta-1,4-mannosyl-glycoprotein beta-1,4-N-acetylglucosaminyltransferase